jgi:hypothetical protein
MGSLEILSVWDNQFTGTIPLWIADMTTLKGLSLDLNQFTGTIPSNLFDKLSNLGYVYMNGNKL